MKRLFDLIVSLAAIIILSPLFIVLGLLILLTMGWPIFYLQARVGRGGRLFKIVKFRSMVRRADKQGPSYTVGGDPRITPVGRFLRKHKLDEIPQLFNVLAGQMSFVGPRPEVPEYVELYTDAQRRVLSVKPGLTDPASIVYRDEEKVLARYEDSRTAYVEKIMPAKLKLNMAYLEKATFGKDLGLILETLKRLFWHR
jgi:lipopolysaccharide/colanic/teichoic acid biosynthesis glycosyltransferase